MAAERGGPSVDELLRRAEEEDAAARRAGLCEARLVHERLAECYRARAQGDRTASGDLVAATRRR